MVDDLHPHSDQAYKDLGAKMQDVKSYPKREIKEKIQMFLNGILKVRDLLFFSVGFALAVFMLLKLYEARMDEVTMQNAIVYKGKVYTVNWDATKGASKEEVKTE